MHLFISELRKCVLKVITEKCLLIPIIFFLADWDIVLSLSHQFQRFESLVFGHDRFFSPALLCPCIPLMKFILCSIYFSLRLFSPPLYIVFFKYRLQCWLGDHELPQFALVSKCLCFLFSFENSFAGYRNMGWLLLKQIVSCCPGLWGCL